VFSRNIWCRTSSVAVVAVSTIAHFCGDCSALSVCQITLTFANGGGRRSFLNELFGFYFYFSRSEIFIFPQTPNPTPCGVGRGLGEQSEWHFGNSIAQPVGRDCVGSLA
jgi:hypothetical protein